MKNINKVSPSYFALMHILWTVIIALLYWQILFLPLPGFSYWESISVCAGTVIVSVAAGFILTVEKRRNDLSIAINVLGSFAVYFVLSFRNVSFTGVFISIVVSCIIAITYGCFAIYFYVKYRRFHISVSKCVKTTLLSMRTLAILVFLPILLISTLIPLWGNAFLERQSGERSKDSENYIEEGKTIDQNMDTLVLLEEDNWAQLNVTQRMEVLKTVADIETNTLGIPEVGVLTETLDENLLGYYADYTRSVVINLNHLMEDDSYTVCQTLIHEVYHAYIQRLVEIYNCMNESDRRLYFFYEIAQYSEEADNYVSGYEDYDAYASQACEMDSDYYALEATTVIFMLIEQYLSEK